MPLSSYPFPYGMPSPNGVAEASGNNTPGNTEGDGNSPDGKEKLPIKRSKGSLGSLNMITGKNNEPGKEVHLLMDFTLKVLRVEVKVQVKEVMGILKMIGFWDKKFAIFVPRKKVEHALALNLIYVKRRECPLHPHH